MSWNHSYTLDEYQIHKINTVAITELPGEAYFNAKVLLKCCSELLTQLYVYFLCRFQCSVSIHSSTGFILGTCHVCNRQASKDERFSKTGREINKDIVALKNLSQIPVARKDCQILQTAFHYFKR